jgi:beta-galactosidase
VDDETGNGGSVVFEVWTDDERRHTSPVLRGSGSGAEIDVDVTGAQVLRLRVTDAGDGNGLDHANWATAALACTD